MADPSLPPDIAKRIAELEGQVKNLARQQNPPKGALFELNDVSAQPPADGSLLTYDRSLGQWAPAAASYVGPGELVFSASATVPTGTVLCNGASALRTDFPALYAAIGTTYGAVDGTHFNVPNFADRFPVGVSGSKVIGATGGSADAIVVSHSHTVGAHRTNVETGGFGLTASISFQDRVMIESSPGIASSSTGSSGTGANLPPWLACYVYIRY